MPKKLITACLKVTFNQSSIDSDKGIITGVKVMELGKLATFSGKDGKPKSVKITSRHIDALLSHAGNRAVPIHLTHDWTDAWGKPNEDTVEMNARVGALKKFRKDDQGDLIADAYLKDGESKRDILFGAEHNPEDNMISAVFGYEPDDAECIPQNFRAADIVPKGAATTALFSETKTNDKQTTTMDEELKKQIHEMIVSAIAEAMKAKPAPETDPAEMEDAAAQTAEMEAGVTDEDKKPEDDKKPAMLRASLRIHRAGQRLATAAMKAQAEKLKTEAEAAVTATLGQHKFIAATGDVKTTNEVEAYINAQVATGCKREVALFRMAKDKPELYNSFRKAGKI